MSIFTRHTAPKPSRASIHRPRGLTASAVNAKNEAAPLRRLAQPWQALALARYDDVGECWYPAQFYSRTMQRVRFYPGFRDEKGDIQEVENGPLADLWDQVQDPGGGRLELTGSYGQLMFITGDGYLVDSVQDDERAFEFLSPAELRVKPQGEGGYLRLRAPGLTPEELADAPDDAFEPTGNEARVYRLYRRHPAYSFWSDSPVRAVLDLYQLIKMLTLAANAEAQSRAATRGLLYMPDDLSFGNPDSATGGEENVMEDTFAQDFIEILANAIRDPGSAEAMAPTMIRGPGLVQTGAGTSVAMADLIKWMPLGPADSYRAVDAWDKVIERIGNGLDMPRSIVSGEAKNHWGDWIVDEQGFRQHVAPVCDRFASDLVSAYLRPAAKAAGIANWMDVAIGYDPSAAVNHPDETATAQTAWRDGIVSSEFYRDSIGATEEDAPTEEDQEWLLAVLGKPEPPAEDEAAETAPQDGGTGNDTAEVPPTSPDATTASALMAREILGASRHGVTRARALAGARLRTRSQGCEPCQETVKAVAPSMIASALGPDTVRGIINGHSSEASLVAGAGDELAETLERLGLTGEWPHELGNLVEMHALRTLYEAKAPPLPAGFTAVVAKAVA